jgi:hypothetical protein
MKLPIETSASIPAGTSRGYERETPEQEKDRRYVLENQEYTAHVIGAQATKATVESAHGRELTMLWTNLR